MKKKFIGVIIVFFSVITGFIVGALMSLDMMKEATPLLYFIFFVGMVITAVGTILNIKQILTDLNDESKK